jgi:hypothetical protein
MLALAIHAPRAQELDTLDGLIATEWAAGAPWDDGLAEVATYEGHRVVQGADRPHTVVVLTRAEDLNREHMTRAEWPYGEKPILRGLRQSQIASVPGPNYPTHFAVHLFFERDDISLPIRVVASAQEWEGTTFKEFDQTFVPPRQTYSSFHDGEGRGTRTLTSTNAWFEEQLPLVLRTLPFEEGLRAMFALYDPQATTRAAAPKATTAVLRVERPAGAVRVPAGTWEPERAWQVTVQAQDGRTLRYAFAAEEPHPLLSFDASDGRAWQLERLERRAYWKIGG